MASHLWHNAFAKPTMRKCVIFHQHPLDKDTYKSWVNKNGYMAKFDAKLRIELWTGHLSTIPERHAAFAYQTAEGMYLPERFLEPPKWEIDADSISPMTYFGVQDTLNGVLVCMDERGHVHVLEPGDKVIHSTPGNITINHYPAPNNPYA
jgi:hypothetical protein